MWNASSSSTSRRRSRAAKRRRLTRRPVAGCPVAAAPRRLQHAPDGLDELQPRRGLGAELAPAQRRERVELRAAVVLESRHSVSTQPRSSRRCSAGRASLADGERGAAELLDPARDGVAVGRAPTTASSGSAGRAFPAAGRRSASAWSPLEGRCILARIHRMSRGSRVRVPLVWRGERPYCARAPSPPTRPWTISTSVSCAARSSC
jgi:hypothetical protein